MPYARPHRARPRLTVVIPALFGIRDAAGGAAIPRVPALERLLAGSVTAPGESDPLRAQFALMGVAPGDGELPVAAVTYTADAGEPAQGWWLRADPVHLMAGHDQVMMAPPEALALEASEARALVTEILELFTADGWRLQALHPQRWYLQVPRAPRLRNTPPSEVVGRGVLAHLPAGPDSGIWHRAMNEIQALLHASPVNAAREAAGRPPVNSVWFWGGGALPAPAPRRYAQVWSDDVLTRGLAQLCATPVRALPAVPQAILEAAADGEEHLAVLPPSLAFPDIEQTWARPLLESLSRRHLDAVTIVGPTHYRLTPLRLRLSAWRRRRPLADVLPA